MLSTARRFVRSEDEAQDVVQEAFIAAFKSIDGFNGTARLATWLHRIVVNAALMRLRTRSRRPQQSIELLLPSYLDDGHPAEPAIDWGDTAQQAISRDETRVFIREAIEKLPDNYRIVLMLRDIEGLSTEEAARTLGIEPNAAKVRLHRARQALRTLLDERFRSGAI